MVFAFRLVYHELRERRYHFEVVGHRLCCLALRVATSNILDLFDRTLCHHFDRNPDLRDHRASYLLLLAHVRRDHLVRDLLLRAFRGLSVHRPRDADVHHLQLVRLVSDQRLVSNPQNSSRI